MPGLGYDDMATAEGRAASAIYRCALANDGAAKRQQTVANLRAYCQRYTLAMVELREALGALAQSAA